jgi:hypothetical protein
VAAEAAQPVALQMELQHSPVKGAGGVLGAGAGQDLPQLGTSALLLAKSSTGGLMGRLDLSLVLAVSKPAGRSCGQTG